MTRPAVQLKGLGYAYPDGTRALDGIDLAVRPGERVALIGPNGAGKTTLMLHLNGLAHPTSGSVEIDGMPVSKANLDEVRQRVGFLFQDPDDQLFMPTVYDDVAFGPRNLGLNGDEIERRVRGALRHVGMAGSEDRMPHHLSFGERRRVALATVLAMSPQMLALDEPSSNLDPRGRRALINLLAGLDATLLVATHDLELALELCERSVLLDGGRLIADGSTREIVSDDRLTTEHGLEVPPSLRPR